MADESFSYSVEGLQELIAKTDGKVILQPLRDFFTRCAIAAQGRARQNAPSDTGGLRNKILYEVDDKEPPLYSKIGLLEASEGSPLWYQGRAMEYGTGRMGDPAVGHQAGHWPPGAALETWATRHGFHSGWQVANIIGRRGGLRPHPFLRPALADSMSDIKDFLGKLKDDIESLWSKR